MDILFRREQTSGTTGRAKFKLWGKIELDDNESEMVERYRFDQAILIAAFQPELIRNTGLIGAGVFVLALALLSTFLDGTFALLGGLIAGGGVGYWYFNEKRETIFVRDLMHGRHFTCNSVVELARKEAWLHLICGFLRQVMESAKHWDGTEKHAIEALPKDEARQVIIKGI
jgi:hypothetical protein